MVPLMSSSQEQLSLIDAFVRGLNHYLRTPLSTISNELHYLGSLTSEKEVARSKEKCREISLFLDGLQIPGIRNQVKLESLDEILAGLNITIAPNVMCYCSLEPAKFAFDTIALFINASFGAEDFTVKRFFVSDENKVAKLSFEVPFSNLPAKPGNYNSLTQFCTVCMDKDAHLPALAESIFWAFNMKTELQCDQAYVYSVEIPVEYE